MVSGQPDGKHNSASKCPSHRGSTEKLEKPWCPLADMKTSTHQTSIADVGVQRNRIDRDVNEQIWSF